MLGYRGIHTVNEAFAEMDEAIISIFYPSTVNQNSSTMGQSEYVQKRIKHFGDIAGGYKFGVPNKFVKSAYERGWIP
jgi:hypothetical protein